MNFENNYVVKQLASNIAVVFSCNFDSPLNYLDLISEELTQLDFQGLVIFDLLLSNGLESNRFISIEFENGLFKNKSIEVLDQIPQVVLNESFKFYMRNLDLFEGSILGDYDFNIHNISFSSKSLNSVRF